MYINKVIDHRKTVRFGFVSPKLKIREFHCEPRKSRCNKNNI